MIKLSYYNLHLGPLFLLSKGESFKIKINPIDNFMPLSEVTGDSNIGYNLL